MDNPKLIIDYYVVRELDTRALATVVQRKIKEGWVPYGSLVTASPSAGSVVYCQSMVKYANVYATTIGGGR